MMPQSMVGNDEWPLAPSARLGGWLCVSYPVLYIGSFALASPLRVLPPS